MKKRLYQIADELRAIANAGMQWAENGYHKERFEKVLNASARLVSVIESGSEEDVIKQYYGNLAHLSPVLCVEAVVFRDDRILLIQRSDDHTWAIPGGLLEVGESPAQGAERELWEESGVRGKAIQLLALYDSRFWPSGTRMQICIAQFLMQANGDPALHNDSGYRLSSLSETLDFGFFREDALPDMHIGHDQRVPMAFKFLRGELTIPYFDGWETGG